MPQMKNSYDTLSGPEKAAVFLFALGEDQAGKIFKLMDDDEIRVLSQKMAHLGSVGSEVIEHLFVEFSEQVSSAGSLVGTVDSTERLLAKMLDKNRAQEIMDEIRGPSGRTIWEKLSNVNEAVLANFLKNEYPQTVAVVLSRIKTAHAAKVLAQLPENFALEVVTRMLRMEGVQQDVLQHVERTLRSEFMSNLARTTRRDTHEIMADIFNSLDRKTESQFMSALEERNQESAERIRQLMFTFDDLLRINSTGIQSILRLVPKEKLALGLKGASQEVKTLFFNNMSERAGKMMREDMEAMGPVRLRDVDEAQAAIVAAARTLADSGEIVIAGNDGDGQEEMVE